MAKAQTQQLLGLLERNEVLRTKGFSSTATPAGGIAVDRAGHVHGIWDHDGRWYTWLSPGSREPAFRTGDAKSALLYTLVTLAQGMRDARD